MKLKELQEKGGFVDPVPVVKSVTWTPPPVEQTGADGTVVLVDQEPVTFDIHVLRLSAGSYERLITPEDNKRARSARLLSECLLLGEGEDMERITYQQAFDLEVSLSTVLLTAVNEVVNRPAKKA